MTSSIRFSDLAASVLVAVVAVALAPAAHGNDLWVVHPSGFGDFTDIQPAVDAAGPGDVVLVHSGTYTAVTVSKSLSIVAAHEASVDCGGIEVLGLGAGERVLFSGLDTDVATGVAARVVDCAGAVRFQDCDLSGAAGSNGGVVQQSADVVFVDSELQGGWVTGTAPRGVFVGNATVAFLSSRVVGGHGRADEARDGGDAARVFGSSFVFLSDTTIVGGHGSDATEVGNEDLGGGGDGLVLGDQAEVIGQDSQVWGGSGGFCEWFGCSLSEGEPGEALVLLSPDASYTPLATPSRVLSSVRSVAPECDEVEIRFDVEPGDAVFLLLGTEPVFEFSVDPLGVRGLELPVRRGHSTRTGHEQLALPLRLDDDFLGDVPAPPLLLTIPVRSLRNHGATVVHAQALIVPPSGPHVLTNPLALTLWPEDLDCDADGRNDRCQIASNPGLDQDGNGVIDACEGALRLYVDRDAAPGGDGSSWALAFDVLNDALAHANDLMVGGEIWIAEGVYAPAGPGGPREASFLVPPGVALYGGFAGDETGLDERDPIGHPTVLTGDLLGDDSTGGGIDENAYHVVRLLPGAGQRIDGFTITGGNMDGVGETLFDRAGGGVNAADSSQFLIANCLFEKNYAVLGGGALVARDAGYDVVNCRFVENRCHDMGGAILSWGWLTSDIGVVNSTFVGNVAEGTGGGHDGGWGGAVFLRPMTDDGDEVQFVQCTFYRNRAGDHSGGIRVSGTVMPEQRAPVFVHNGVFLENFAGNDVEHIEVGTYDPHEVTYSCLDPLSSWIDGHNNVIADPQFMDPTGPDWVPGTLDDDLRLTGSSPGVDAGRNAWLLPDVADLDRDGDTAERVPFDLAYEPRRADDPSVPDRGSGAVPVVDMGAYERQP